MLKKERAKLTPPPPSYYKTIIIPPILLELTLEPWREDRENGITGLSKAIMSSIRMIVGLKVPRTQMNLHYRK